MRGATSSAVSLLRRYCHFNPRSHKGSDTGANTNRPDLQRFQSTLPQGERQRHCNGFALLRSISIHAPTRGATFIRAAYVPNKEFQSTLPRGERLFLTWFTGGTRKISIHAPTRGATNLAFCHRQSHLISIHAPTRGATVSICADAISFTRFQSTLPRGERLLLIFVPIPCKIFQSTLPRGERPLGCPFLRRPSKFQSTLPRGERRRRQREVVNVDNISIHAPTRGATFLPFY